MRLSPPIRRDEPLFRRTHTDKSGSYGVTILTDCKNGSDKPADNTLRVTLLRSPGTDVAGTYSDQGNQDWGHHEFTLGLAGHSGNWRPTQYVVSAIAEGITVEQVNRALSLRAQLGALLARAGALDPTALAHDFRQLPAVHALMSRR